MRFGSVCSGIEAASVAWESLGWEAAWFAEISPFPSSVLAHRFPGVRNHGSLVGLADRLVGRDREIDLLVGGTPCQSFSIAGLGGGLADERGNLALEYCRVAAALRPRWCLWENVPNVLSAKHARDFASIVGALVQLGYGCCWRVLDARHFGVPQRRRRVFLVASLGGAAAAGSVLFEPESLRRDSPKKRAAGEEVAGTLGGGSGGRGWSPDTDRMTFVPVVARPLRAQGQDSPREDSSTYVATNAEGSDGFTLTKSNLSKTVNNQTPLVAFDPTQVTHPENRSTCDGKTTALARSARPPHIAFSSKDYGGDAGPLSPTLRSGNAVNSNPSGGVPPAIAYSLAPVSGGGGGYGATATATATAISSSGEAKKNSRGTHIVQCVTGEQTHPLTSVGADASEDGTGRGTPIIPAATWKVRRLTPLECERLQAFPDGWTDVPGASDSTRYAALGNSMAVVVMRWLGQRIALVDRVLRRTA